MPEKKLYLKDEIAAGRFVPCKASEIEELKKMELTGKYSEAAKTRKKQWIVKDDDDLRYVDNSSSRYTFGNE